MSAVMDPTAELRHAENDRRTPRRGPSWPAIAAMLLSVTVPVCGWMVSLSNRVAALEERTQSLATAAQMAEVKQKISDWIEESDRARERDRQPSGGRDRQ